MKQYYLRTFACLPALAGLLAQVPRVTETEVTRFLSPCPRLIIMEVPVKYQLTYHFGVLEIVRLTIAEKFAYGTIDGEAFWTHLADPASLFSDFSFETRGRRSCWLDEKEGIVPL